MSTVALNLTYSLAQSHAFFDHPPGKYFVYPKGRRAGFTRGGMQAALEWGLEGIPVLWGDTVNTNIRKYVERYALPVLKSHRVPHTWNVVEKTLHFPGGGFIDFRSADNPENWEGFGYKKILLNEAGIILEGPNGEYLYKNSVLPMLLDYPDSELYAFGVPKRRGDLFDELYQRAISGQDGYYGRTFSSYDTPFIRRASIAALEAEMRQLGGQDLVDQEIYGRFVDLSDGALRVIPAEWVRAAFARWSARTQPGGWPSAVGVDIARGGKDKTVFAPRWGTYWSRLLTFPGSVTKDGPAVQGLLAPLLGPSTDANIDVVGVGTSPYDHVRGVHPNTWGINGGAKSDARTANGRFGFANVRSELYWRLREALDPATGLDLALPPDEELLADLTAAGWEPRGDKLLVESKDVIKPRLRRSPDKGDAVMYSLFEPFRGYEPDEEEGSVVLSNVS
ncbi:hypothetical protein [Deinococcus pimensis]|uniref:hypothetical protein n=1 Tax=Deinococcus pimensis TaxID=309888 RepID=UPI0004AF4D72|nr:hypothetical protein [Deinococcus pimensis]